VRTRTRALIAGLGLGVALVVVSAPAYAAETPTSEPHFTKEAGRQCYELAKKGGDFVPDDCQKAPSPLKPANNEIIWGSAAFVVLLVAMWKWGVPAVRNMEKAREDRIRTDLETAEKARLDAEAEAAQYRAQLGDARNEAARIIDEARQAADGVARDIRARAEAEANEIRTKAAEDISLQHDRALADLRQAVATMSVELASKIVERNLDAATQQQLIDSYIASVGRSN
jgi:F-type H+-transporting ATPase subunit b